MAWAAHSDSANRPAIPAGLAKNKMPCTWITEQKGGRFVPLPVWLFFLVRTVTIKLWCFSVSCKKKKKVLAQPGICKGENQPARQQIAQWLSLKRRLRLSTSESLDKAWSQLTVISHSCHLGHACSLSVVNCTLIIFFIIPSNLIWQGKPRNFIVASQESIFQWNLQRIWIETGTTYALIFFIPS